MHCFYYFFEKMLSKICLLIFFSIPDFVVGIPVTLAICLFILYIPTALFNEKETPGILNFIMTN